MLLLGPPRDTSNVWYYGPSTEALSHQNLREPVRVAGRTYPKRLSAVSPFPLPVLNPRGVEVVAVRPYFGLFNWSALVISRRGKSQSLDRL